MTGKFFDALALVASIYFIAIGLFLVGSVCAIYHVVKWMFF